MVAESAGLGDFGVVVGDKPGFVAVPQSVEGKAGRIGRVPFRVSPSLVARWICSSPARKRGRVMVQADAGVLGGPSQS